MELPTNGRFFSVERTSRLTGLSISVLRRRKADGSFTAGKEYIYRSGKKGGPVGWDPCAIEKWQIKQSQLIAEAPVNAASEIESFAAMGV
tara:strand:- start:98 stop:367 length:270 start_codon:yes stop_codon:yes gene_type:complete